MARPTKLTKELVDQAREFVSKRKADRILLPTIEGLASELGISRETIYDWSEKPDAASAAVADSLGAETKKTLMLRDEFSDIVSELKAAQAEKLIQLGLSGRYNASITKLILSGKHGYVEKQQTDLTTNGKDLPSPILGGITKDGDVSSHNSNEEAATTQ